MKLMIDDAVWGFDQIFSEFGEVVTLPGRQISNESLQDCDALIVRSRTRVDEELLRNSKIQFVGSTVAGLDHIDQPYLEDNAITLSSAQGCNSNAVAEYVISAIANLSHDYNFKLSDRTLGIIGVGNVGRRLDLKAKQLGIKTLLNDPPRESREGSEHFVSLEEALGADIVTFHTPLTFSGIYSTHNLLDSHNFNHIKKDAIIINAARGGIINELIWEKTPTKANIIDCWENEPNINPTLQKSAYWATPHIAGHSIDAKFMGSFMIYKDLCKYIKKPLNDNIEHLINPELRIIRENNLHETLNSIYSFQADDKAIQDISNFEDYRRNYPERYEWRHFETEYKLPKGI
ncbi:MAG: 4-phosphoerythronate dehydrogenase [Candidatus Pseudothioglobus sp.]|nr:4-phosphoerythronate dehydrogenase [Candidatus Thioglobus sp.]|tara:strand:- start:2259 stop:3299 length:1041 start_codon:yes stop_codon:yes gene_type:complete